jgi:nicotinamide mononucleotide transporter
MNVHDIFTTFYKEVQNTSWPEWWSTLAQIASVWYARKNNVLVYPTGIIGVLLAAYVYFFAIHPPLYADGTLNIYYFIMSVYGWYNWILKKEGNEFAYPITWCKPRERYTGLIIFLLSWMILDFVLLKFTNSNTPHLDSLVSSSAILAMWWMAKRKIDNWIAWIVSNIIAIPLNFYKGLMLFTLMYILFLIMAWAGYLEWKKIYAHSKNENG